MISYTITLIIGITFLFLFLGPRATLEEAPALMNEEYLVYSAVITQMYGESQGDPLVIRERISKGERYPVDGRLKAQNPTLDDFKRKNEAGGKLSNDFTSTSRVVLLSAEEERALCSDDWASFHEKYPHASGVLSFSRVGLNQDRTEAVVYVDRMEGNLCGRGYLVLLSRGSEGWKIQQQCFLWIS